MPMKFLDYLADEIQSSPETMEGLGRVKESFKNPGQYLIFNDPRFQAYMGNLGGAVSETAKGIPQMVASATPPVNLAQRIIDPNASETTARQNVNTLSNAVKAKYMSSPVAPVAGAIMGTAKGLRKSVQKSLNNEIVSPEEVVDPMQEGISNQPGLGEVITDNPEAQNAINLTLMAILAAKSGHDLLKHQAQPSNDKIISSANPTQKALEDAWNAGDTDKAQKIISSMKDSDPYKVSMQSLQDMKMRHLESEATKALMAGMREAFMRERFGNRAVDFAKKQDYIPQTYEYPDFASYGKMGKIVSMEPQK